MIIPLWGTVWVKAYYIDIFEEKFYSDNVYSFAWKDCSLGGPCAIVEYDLDFYFPELVPAQAIESLIIYNQQLIDNLPEQAFKRNNTRLGDALINKFDAVAYQIDNGDYKGAEEKLTRDIRVKMDGSVDGSPQNDWIIDPKAQQELCENIDTAIGLIGIIQ